MRVKIFKNKPQAFESALVKLSTMIKETATQRKRRLQKEKLKRQVKFQHEPEAAKSARLAKRRKRAEEVPEKQRNVALAHAKERIAQSRASREKC